MKVRQVSDINEYYIEKEKWYSNSLYRKQAARARAIEILSKPVVMPAPTKETLLSMVRNWRVRLKIKRHPTISEPAYVRLVFNFRPFIGFKCFQWTSKALPTLKVYPMAASVGTRKTIYKSSHKTQRDRAIQAFSDFKQRIT